MASQSLRVIVYTHEVRCSYVQSLERSVAVATRVQTHRETQRQTRQTACCSVIVCAREVSSLVDFPLVGCGTVVVQNTTDCAAQKNVARWRTQMLSASVVSIY